MGSMKGKQAKIDAALDRLADMFEGGNLLASADPVGFIDAVVEELKDLRQRVKAADAIRAGGGLNGVVTKILEGLDGIIGRYWEPALVREKPHTYISEISEMIAEKLNANLTGFDR